MRKTLTIVFILLMALPLVSVATANDQISVEVLHQEVDGINYYVEKRGRGPYLVMVASGQGDSEAYKFLADILAQRYTVITFDPPGFSRSGPPPTWEGLSSKSLASEVAALVESLGIEKATFYGSSSGGTTILSLIADNPQLVRNAIIHEPANVAESFMMRFALPKVVWFQSLFTGGISEGERANLYSEEKEDDITIDLEKYRELGDAHMERRINNKQIWFDRYAYPDIPCCNRLFTEEELKKAPITITIGEFSIDPIREVSMALVERASLNVVELPAKHYPYVTIPKQVAEVVFNSEPSENVN